jgi:hypothetical protein
MKYFKNMAVSLLVSNTTFIVNEELKKMVAPQQSEELKKKSSINSDFYLGFSKNSRNSI